LSVDRHRPFGTGLIALALLALAGCPEDPPASDDDDSAGEAALLLDDLEIEINPTNVLSAYVRWHTDVPATSRIEFGEGGVPRFFVEDEAPVTDHELFVFGLHPKSATTLWITSTTADGTSGELQTVHTTPALPFDEASFQVTVYEGDAIQPGWTLINQMVGAIIAPTIAMMIDEQGKPVWYHRLDGEPTFGDVQATLVDGHHVLIGGCVPPSTRPVMVDLTGEPVWEGPLQADQAYGPGAMHHTLQRLANGDFLTMTYDLRDGVMIDIIEQFGEGLDTVWRWDAGDHLPEAAETHLHGNTALVDLERDVAYFHAHQLGLLYQIDRASGEVLWTFGDGGDFTMLGEPTFPWPEYAHAAEFLDDGHLLLHDNGDAETRGFTRAAEYVLDEDAMTAELVWEYPGEHDDFWYNYAWGDADRLDNGNTLITSGSMIPWDSQSRLLEVTPSGEVVWEVWIGTPEGGLAGAYMAERVPVLVGTL